VRAMELRREAYLLMETIKFFVEGKIRAEHGKLYDHEGKQLIGQPCLADRIDHMIKDE
jgi:hypothetical protein